ncbi:hypothetical protein BUALT_Bualt07G0089400 [Buddleja alternifolia]|uniref:Uncharacterized protein n=1 Tax=Buddleja alternifolia TaxID=168488 RepID=A0AAV6X9G1_9LAMI|nr:hypothetical protein BUALT_Bualt07G0089400 [Buddleja alternifolia]
MDKEIERLRRSLVIIEDEEILIPNGLCHGEFPNKGLVLNPGDLTPFGAWLRAPLSYHGGKADRSNRFMFSERPPSLTSDQSRFSDLSSNPNNALDPTFNRTLTPQTSHNPPGFFPLTHAQYHFSNTGGHNPSTLANPIGAKSNEVLPYFANVGDDVSLVDLTVQPSLTLEGADLVSGSLPMDFTFLAGGVGDSYVSLMEHGKLTNVPLPVLPKNTIKRGRGRPPKNARIKDPLSGRMLSISMGSKRPFPEGWSGQNNDSFQANKRHASTLVLHDEDIDFYKTVITDYIIVEMKLNFVVVYNVFNCDYECIAYSFVFYAIIDHVLMNYILLGNNMPSAKKEKLTWMKGLFIPSWEQRPTIPAAFAQRARLTLQSRLTIKTILATFNFGVERVEGLLMLERTEWDRFQKMHSLQMGDFIHFHHLDDMVFHATVMIPSGSSKNSNQDIYVKLPESLCLESSIGEDDDEEGETDDSMEEDEGKEEDDDDTDMDEEAGFTVMVPRSEGCDYVHGRLATLCIPSHAWRAYGLDSKRVAKFKPVWKGTARDVQLKWKAKLGVEGQGMENPLVRAYVWNGEPAMVQFNAIFGPTIINVSSDSCRSCGEGPNDTIVVEDSEEADQISLSLENTLSRKSKGRLDHYSSSQGSSSFPPPRYGYATPAPFPMPQYNFKIKETADDDTLDETVSSTERIMLKLMKDRFLSLSKAPLADSEKAKKKTSKKLHFSGPAE